MLHNRELTFKARQLRKNMTKEERRLWFDFLKDCPVKFTAQKVLGNYIVDFCSSKQRIIIEIDGEQHFSCDEQIASDEHRDKFLKSLGYTVLRYSNLDIQKNFDVVCQTIYSHFKID